MKAERRRRWALPAAAAALAGSGWVVFGSAATLTVSPKNASAFRTCVLTGYPTTTVAVSDSWVDENDKSARKAAATVLGVQSRSGQNARAFIRFDLAKCVPRVAGTAAVTRATLRLNLVVAPTANRTYNLHRVTAPCPEAATTCWTESGLTWSTQPGVAATPTSTLALTAASATNQYYAFDVTADAAAMVAGTASNYGWRIADSVESNATSINTAFKAKDATDNAAGAPQLVVVYAP